MNQAQKATKKKSQIVVVPNHFEQAVDPIKSRVTSGEERVGYNVVIEKGLGRE